MSAKSSPAIMHFIPDPAGEATFSLSSDLLSQQPATCLILRTNGDLWLLDLGDGHEHVLSNSIELFWVTCGQSGEKANLIEEVSWLDYSHRGMEEAEANPKF
ncbi:uncharacterized protein LOC120251541 isoform X2 [Dioscorea cayenensis subsp. rotundata]|uniref:Uncharacterized protein LOC120251541 isoform X2 n=1 Tax=Dioscorea cayennensis subsp. rotundata TaxID=55577 RepID=A0AB40ALY6_DIOCR|nr:uncharacterized protein LOC120251541 isoform X2 [Dioscorea cayenensis subsp. rotundata]